MALTTNVSATMAVYYSKVFLEKARLLIRHDAFAQKRAVPANNGKVVSFTRHAQPASNTATTAVTEAVTPSSLLVSGITVTASLTEYGAYTMVSKFYERTSVDVGLKEQIESMGVHMGENIDTIIRNAIVTGGGVAQYASNSAATSFTSIASSSILSSPDIRKAVKTLKKKKAIPFQGTQGNPVFGGLIGPECAYDLLGDSTWQATQQYVNPDPMKRGILGTFFGVEFVETNNNYVGATGVAAQGSACYITWIVGKEAYGVVSIDSEDVTSPGAAQLIIKDSGPNDTGNPLSMWSTVGWYAPFATQVLNTDWIIELYSPATA